MRLLIGIPCMDFVHVEFMRSLSALIVRLKDENIDFELDIESGTLVYLARERIAHKAINEGFTHVLWLDSDMVFGEDVLEDLMFSGKPFVSCIYHARRKGYASCVFKSIEPGGDIHFDEYPAELFQIAGCGFGCLLITTEILSYVLLHYGTCFSPLPNLGEDLAFCKRVTDLGYQIWCDPAVVCGHIGHITIYPEDYQNWKTTISNYSEVAKNGS